MSKIPLSGADFDPNARLLPIEVEADVNGIKKMVPIDYFAQITMAKDKVSQKSGNGFLELTLSIDIPGKERVSIVDILSYVPAARWKITNAVEKLKMDKNSIDTDDFMGLWAIVNLGYREYEIGEPDPITGNKRKQKDNVIASYIRLATPEEVSKVMGIDNSEVHF